MIGTTVSHYHVLERVGAGGMGVVYKAEDTHLHRIVALKFLPESETASDQNRARLAREARSAATLSHPNIATIYDYDEVDDEATHTRRAFIAMEYVDGEPLTARIGRGPMPFDQVRSILIQIADALQSAHAHGIIHRDIKPANILCAPNGTVKLLDFGIARRLDETRLTAAGEVAGSAAYMSPEQLRDDSLDARTDIWSFGVVAFEMMTQHLPFRGEHPAALTYSITNETPIDPRSFRADIPEDLRSVCLQCLARDPADRPDGAAKIRSLLGHTPGLAESTGSTPAHHRLMRSRPGLIFVGHHPRTTVVSAFILLLGLLALLLPSQRVNIGRWIGMSSLPDAKHIAVLPFRLVGDDARGRAVCDGLLETVTAALINLPLHRDSLWVVPASDIIRSDVRTVRDAKQFFGVTLVITGSFQVPNNRLTLTLNDAVDVREIDARTIDFDSTSTSVIQDRATRELLSMLHTESRASMVSALTLGGTARMTANDPFLQGRGDLLRARQLVDDGRAVMQRLAGDSLDTAIHHFARALDLDPSFARAYTAMADAYWLKFRSTKDPQSLHLADSLCRRSLVLTNRLPETYVLLARILSSAGSYWSAGDALRQALSIDSTSHDALVELARTTERLGDAVDAEKLFRRAIALRPEYWMGNNALGGFYIRQRRFEDAAAQYRMIIARMPDNFFAYNNLGAAYFRQNDRQAAAAMFESSLALRPNYAAYSNLASIYYAEARYADAVRVYGRALDVDSADYAVWGNLAVSCRMAPGNEARIAGAAQRAIALAEIVHRRNPLDAEVMADLGSYYVLLRDRSHAIPLLRSAVDHANGRADILATAGTAFEEIGERGFALDVLGRAYRAGYAPEDVERNPLMSKLVKDPRYARIRSGSK